MGKLNDLADYVVAQLAAEFPTARVYKGLRNIFFENRVEEVLKDENKRLYYMAVVVRGMTNNELKTLTEVFLGPKVRIHVALEHRETEADPAATYTEFNNIKEAVIDLFDRDLTLGDVVTVADVPQQPVDEERFITDILCHYAEFEIATTLIKQYPTLP